MNDETPLPAKVPVKRRQIETLLDVHIAMWLASDDISPSERRKLEAEKARRKALKGEEVIVCFLQARTGMSPVQRQVVGVVLDQIKPTLAIHVEDYGGAIPRFHALARKLEIPQELYKDEREAIRRADVVIATPNTATPPRRDQRYGTVWSNITYAADRDLPVKIILPDGHVKEGISEQ